MIPPRLHVVTNDRVLDRPDLLARAEALALGPEVALHVRSRRPGRPLLALVEQFVALARRSGTRVIVNDRADLARLAGADGVQLPEAGLSATAARAVLPQGWIGCSRHGPGARPPGTDWTMIGPIWATSSHPDRPALGLAPLAASGDRTVAIGGITPDRAREAVRAGAFGIAAISALWDAPDPAAAARALLLSFSP